MINSIKKGAFVLPNGGKVVKAYGYIYGLIESMLFIMNQKDKKLIVYNPVVPLNEMAEIVKKELNIKKPIISLPIDFLSVIAFELKLIFKLIGKKSDIHPVRVRKASFPTNIYPKYIIENGFEFKYGDLCTKNSLNKRFKHLLFN